MQIKKIFLSAILPLSLSSGLDPISRAFDPKIDDPARLAPRESIERNIQPIAQVTARQLPQVPWSDRAWDHNRALLNERYTDGGFTRLGSWPERREYGDRYNIEWTLALPPGSERDRGVASLSPAEKYDLIMGTVRGGLTDANRSSLDKDIPSNGKFPTWWGICEGSAAAALVAPEPVKVVSVYSQHYGVDVPFYAPDVKALVSLLWSSYNGMLRLPEIGRQCDDRGGGACFDVNPASMHMALHHFIGLGRGHLIADVDATRIVWNHPVQGYETTYHRPDKGPKFPARSFQEALMPYDGRINDPRRGTRAPGTAYILGVSTKLFYGENKKKHPLHGSVKREVRTMDMQYELELDRNLNLIGGEWLSRKHPDILWTIPHGTRPDTPGDTSLGIAPWDGMTSPMGWESAARASAKRMMPLRKVVDELVKRSAN